MAESVTRRWAERFIRCVFRPVLFHAKLGDALDQAVRERLIEWKTKIAVLSRIPRYGFLESRISSDRWVEADVLREGCKINEHTVQLERRDPVADLSWAPGAALHTACRTFWRTACTSGEKAERYTRRSF